MPPELGRQLEVMQDLEGFAETLIPKYLEGPDQHWKPGDLLPMGSGKEFVDGVAAIQEAAKQLRHDLLVVLVGDTITEEALPTYLSWLLNIKGVGQEEKNAWERLFRLWAGEEYTHGTTLDRYLLLSGRINLPEVEHSIQDLIGQGFDNRAGDLPYHNFIFTSFQERATQRSHANVGKLARQCGNRVLATICGRIASDEARHAKAYKGVVQEIFKHDPDGMMLAFRDMMKANIVMPAELMRESGGEIGEAYAHFSTAAERLGVYTAYDYIEIMESLIADWDIANQKPTSAEAQKAQEELLERPNKMKSIIEKRNARKKTRTEIDLPRSKWIIDE